MRSATIRRMSTNELAIALLDQIVRVERRIGDRMRGILHELDLTEPQANLMWIVDPGGEPRSLREYASRLHCDPSNITLLSAQLEDKGLAERLPHPRDGRVRTLLLTKSGRATRERLLAWAAARSPLATLDVEEQRQLNTLLNKALKTDPANQLTTESR